MRRIKDRASIDNWPYIAIGALIAIALGAVWLYTVLGVGVVIHQSLYQYRLQSGNLDELHRFAPVVETQVRELPVLKDVSLDSQVKSETFVDVDPQTVTVRGVKKLPTMTISFSLAPKVALADAIVQIHDMEIRLALPSTITTSLAKAKWGRATSLSPPASSINANF
jgi:multidrug efflux pump subunit AcrB